MQNKHRKLKATNSCVKLICVQVCKGIPLVYTVAHLCNVTTATSVGKHRIGILLDDFLMANLEDHLIMSQQTFVACSILGSSTNKYSQVYLVLISI